MIHPHKPGVSYRLLDLKYNHSNLQKITEYVHVLKNIHNQISYPNQRELSLITARKKKLVIEMILLIKTMGETMGKCVFRNRNTCVQAKVHMPSSTTTELLKFERQ